MRARVTLIDQDGTVLADSQANPEDMDNHKDRTEVKEALQNKRGEALRKSPTMQVDMLYVAVPMTIQGKRWVLRVSLFARDINKVLGTIQSRVMLFTALAVFLLLAGALFFSKKLTQSIEALRKAAHHFSQGNFDERVFLSESSELVELSQSFNDMAGKIQDLFQILSRQKEETERILSAMQEGIVVVDDKEKIVLCNENFRNLSESKDCEGKYLWQVMRNAEMNDLMKSVLSSRGNETRQLSFGEKTFLCSVGWLAAHHEFIVSFLDTTSIKNFEQVKKDLVTNVSHELRTPLASIKGFVETLMEEATEPQKQYFDIIQRNTERLISIVEDLLVLSELEGTRNAFRVSDVALDQLGEYVIKIFSQRIQKKELSVSLEKEPGFPLVQADPFQLEQVFINLLDNAIKYTEKGFIRVRLFRSAGKKVIEIQDSGIGIPREHLGRIFERFYVVDKSRSKKLGGTGLGLSIVKHIVLMHQGNITVESTPGIGTKVTVILP